MKKIIVVDDENNEVESAYVEDIRRNNWNYRCTHTWLFNNKGEVLISKRPKTEIRYPSMWTSSCGGKVDAGESYKEAAKREMKEELGIEIEVHKIADFVLEHKHYKVFHELFEGRAEGGFKVDKNEIEEIKWIEMEDLKKDVGKNPKKYVEPFKLAFKEYLKKKK